MLFKENQQTELKRALKLPGQKEILINEVTAFLNTLGGTLYIGIDDDGTIIGLSNNTSEYITKISDILNTNILPNTSGLIEIKEDIIDEKTIITIEIADGANLKPFFHTKKGLSPSGCYERRNNQSVQMPMEKITNLNQLKSLQSIETVLSPTQDLTFTALETRYQRSEKSINDYFLRNIGLTTDYGFNYAAYLLSDQFENTTSFVTYHSDSRADINTIQEYKNQSLFTTFEMILHRLENENELRFIKIDEVTGRRIDQEKFDTVAVREILVNAFVHNDYLLSNRSHTPNIAIFPDCLEITSYGRIYDQSAFFSGISIRKNAILSKIFKDLGYGEDLGSGISRILKSYDKTIFNFFDEALRVKIPFWSTNISENKKKPPLIYDTTNYTVPILTVGETTADYISLPLKEAKTDYVGTPLEKEVLEFIFYKGLTSQKEITIYLDKPQRTIQRTLETLKKAEQIDVVGKGKATKYRMKQQ